MRKLLALLAAALTVSTQVHASPATIPFRVSFVKGPETLLNVVVKAREGEPITTANVTTQAYISHCKTDADKVPRLSADMFSTGLVIFLKAESREPGLAKTVVQGDFSTLDEIEKVPSEDGCLVERPKTSQIRFVHEFYLKPLQEISLPVRHGGEEYMLKITALEH